MMMLFLKKQLTLLQSNLLMDGLHKQTHSSHFLRSAVNDGLLTYGDELMKDQNHYRITVPNDIQLQRHLSRGRIMIRS